MPILTIFTCNQFTILNSADLLDDIKSAHIVGPTVMASFDVQLLYTNVLLKETNQIIIEKYFKFHNSQCLDKKSFTKLLGIASTN